MRRSEIGYRRSNKRSEYDTQDRRGRRGSAIRGERSRHEGEEIEMRRGIPGSHWEYEPELRRGRRGRGSSMRRFYNTMRDALEDTMMYDNTYKSYGSSSKHFTQEKAQRAVEQLVNEDGSKGPKWTLEDTTQAAQQMGVSFDKFNKYDWYYTLNLMYSDYCNLFGNNIQSYITLANTFLNDKDGKSGKAYLFYKYLTE